MDNRNPYGWKDSSNSPYYNQPTHNPYHKEIFSILSLLFGLLSLLLACTGIFSIPLGAFGILFAVLASRTGKKKNSMVISGILLSCIGIIFGGLLMVYSFITLPQAMKDPTFQQQMDYFTEPIYGIDFKEFMQKYYGIDLQ